MKPLKFTINIKAHSSYMYCGHLFFVLNSGELAYIPVNTIVEMLAENYPEYNNLIQIAFQRNDYLTNEQGRIFLGIDLVKTALINTWQKASEEMNFVIDLNEEDCTKIGIIPTSPVLDMRLYAMKIYLGTKQGLYEVDLNADNKYNFKPSLLEKRFDAKVTCLNAKSGEIIISCNSEGLFHGSIGNGNKKMMKEQLQVNQSEPAGRILTL